MTSRIAHYSRRVTGGIAAIALSLVASSIYAYAAPSLISATGSSYYVSISGSDTTGTGDISNPWRTIQKAVDTVPSSTILVKSGTYAHFSVNQAGLTIIANPGDAVSVQGVSGVRDVIALNANNTTLSGMTVFGCVPKANPSGGFEDNGSIASVCSIYRKAFLSIRHMTYFVSL